MRWVNIISLEHIGTDHIFDANWGHDGVLGDEPDAEVEWDIKYSNTHDDLVSKSYCGAFPILFLIVNFAGQKD